MPWAQLLGFRDGPRGIVRKVYSEITVEAMARPLPVLACVVIYFRARQQLAAQQGQGIGLLAPLALTWSGHLGRARRFGLAG